ncbi:MAG TPA: RNase A-like domain-containing protein [Jatrophihabitans sp.]|jgi:uncharacterized protein YukE|uniref:RNase A-like domain-containing protein n=1 Tax=Jatrophihabitans sp. TaxID=1932789 RepID=UPI002EF082C8
MAVSRFELPGDGLSAARLCLGQRMPAGDPAQIRAAARRTGAQAADLRRVASALLSRVDTPLWSGPAHRAFVEQIHAHAPSMTATADRYEQYASALHAYAGALDETTPRLVTARSRLRQRHDELVQQLARSQQAPAAFGAADQQGWPAPDTVDLLLTARDFKAGYDRWADALEHCIRALSRADEADPTRDRHGLGGLGGLAHQLTAAASRHLSPFARAMRHPSLHNISDCLSALTTDLTVLGLGLLLICPPAATACLAAATFLALTQLAVDATRRAHGEQVSNTDLGLGLAAAIPIGGAAVRGLRAADNVVHLVPGGGLMAHEGLDGGHTLAKHVGKSEDYLRNRLATEPNLGIASTFHNRQIAESSLSQLLDANARGVERWLVDGSRSLVLNGRMPHPVGVAIIREAVGPVEASGIRLVLKRSATMTTGYRIHTAMVEL